MPYPVDLEAVQWAREAVAGTDLATTSKMIVESFRPVPSSPEAYRPQILRGLMQRHRGGETVLSRGTNWTAEGPLTFQQAQNLFSGTIINVAAPTAGPPNVWLHTRNVVGVLPTLASYTFERRVTDGSTPIDQAFHYAMISDLELTFAHDEPVRYVANGFARRVQTETMTAAISLPSFEVCVAPLMKVYIDSSWATLGTTQVTGQILNGSVKIGSGAGPLRTLDGRTDRDFAAIAYASSRVSIELSLTLLMGPQYAVAKAAAEAQSVRAVRLQIDGTTANQQIQLDMLLKHKVPDLYAGSEYEDEQTIYTIELVETSDDANLIVGKVTNLVAAYA